VFAFNDERAIGSLDGDFVGGELLDIQNNLRRKMFLNKDVGVGKASRVMRVTKL